MLGALLPGLTWQDAVLVMDADTVLAAEFVEVAARSLEESPQKVAIGGVFYGDEGSGLIGQLQRSEFARYSRDVARHQGRVFVLTGTATLFLAGALATVAEHRGRDLPGTGGQVYDRGQRADPGAQDPRRGRRVAGAVQGAD